MKLSLLFCILPAFISAAAPTFENLSYDPAYEHWPSHSDKLLKRRNIKNSVGYTFKHGVASGDPLPDAVILWTKVSPFADGPALVLFNITRNGGLVQEGKVYTFSDVDYTVKIEVTGLLPFTSYEYAFFGENGESIQGSTKTLPSPDADIGSARFAVFSCADYSNGYFTAYRNGILKGVDIALHLGDYIYEFKKKNQVRKHVPNIPRLITLKNYRARHAQYKTDADLQFAHKHTAWLTIWDDHEVADNSWKDGAKAHNEKTDGLYSDRKKAAIQAYFEYMPIRQRNSKRVYRNVKYGKLLDLILLDTRLEGRDQQKVDVYASNRTILGKEQEKWLFDTLKESVNRARWRVIGNQVVFSPMAKLIRKVNGDAWDGYPSNRKRVLNFIESNNITNNVILTGDIHSTWDFDVKHNSKIVAHEFVGTSVTSGVGYPVPVAKVVQTLLGGVLKKATSGLNYFNIVKRGYMILSVDEDKLKNEWFYLWDAKKQGEFREKLGHTRVVLREE